jgi:hypothetical protein
LRGYANLASGLPAFDGARGGSSGEPFVAAPGFKIKVVNGPTPDLFPAMYLVKMQYTRNEIKGRGAFGRRGQWAGLRRR